VDGGLTRVTIQPRYDFIQYNGIMSS
jgi:hypothetical protein